MTDVLGRSAWNRSDVKVVFDEPGAMFLERKDGQRQLVKSVGPWTDHHAELMQKHQAASLTIDEASFGDRTDVAFLLKARPLRELHVSLGKPKDLRAIEQLTELEYLGILGEVVSPKIDSVPAIDLTTLCNLKSANINFASRLGRYLAWKTWRA